MAPFTALNGNESKNSEDVDGSPLLRRRNSEDRTVIRATSLEAQSGEAQTKSLEQSSDAALRRPYYHSKGYSETDGTHKRKRSLSPSQLREPTSTESQGQRPRTEARGSFEVASREREYRRYDEDVRERGEAWYSQHQSREDGNYYESRDPAASGAALSDEQGIDTIQRAASQADSGHDYSATSPDGDESSVLYGGYSQDQSRDPMIQSDPKKRKRNFSNRTKTGCLTCRRRKKKCDETKPECTNCLRGGFVCYGYPNQRGPPNMENKPAAVPLESKDPSYVPPGAYGMPQPSVYPNPPPAPAPKRDSVSYRGPYLRLETSQARPPLTDDDRPTASTIATPSVVSSVMSPDNKSSAFSAYAGASAANMFPTPISALPPNMQQLKTPSIERPREYQRVPPLHDITRTDPDHSRPNTPRPGSLLPMSVLEPTPPAHSGPQPSSSTDPQMAAQLALSHTPFPSTATSRTQKEEMLLGREYHPFDRELVLERERCNAACWRFNESTNPNTGVSTTERSRLFREILRPREPINASSMLAASSMSRTGRVGQEVVVEAPFTCDYGYNITIGNNVWIGRNCTMLDAVEIIIGDNCVIGPNVTLVGATSPHNSSKRTGSKCLQIGGYIAIDDDVCIGAGAIIRHNIRIGKGASVLSGAVVTRDVPRYTVVSGNPAEIQPMSH